MGLYDRRKAPVVVKAKWFSLASKARPREFWVRVGQRVKREHARTQEAVASVVRSEEVAWESAEAKGLKR